MTLEDSSDDLLQVGTVVNDQYVIERVLGAGGFAITYSAIDQHLRRRVALKELFPEGTHRQANGTIQPSRSGQQTHATVKQRFIEEARLQATLHHPNIATIYAVFEANNTAYLALDYIQGDTLQEHVDRYGPLTDTETAKLLVTLVDTLGHIHQTGILHRDIKPSNIILNPAGQPVLIDFGAARTATGNTHHTAIITLGYSPIEQFSNLPVAPTADIYSLAATAYFCLTGTPPPPATERAITNEPLIIPAPDPLRRALISALNIYPQNRPNNTGEFRDLLTQTLVVSRLPEQTTYLRTDPSLPVHQPTLAPNTILAPQSRISQFPPEAISVEPTNSSPADAEKQSEFLPPTAPASSANWTPFPTEVVTAPAALRSNSRKLVLVGGSVVALLFTLLAVRALGPASSQGSPDTGKFSTIVADTILDRNTSMPFTPTKSAGSVTIETTGVVVANTEPQVGKTLSQSDCRVAWSKNLNPGDTFGDLVDRITSQCGTPIAALNCNGNVTELTDKPARHTCAPLEPYQLTTDIFGENVRIIITGTTGTNYLKQTHPDQTNLNPTKFDITWPITADHPTITPQTIPTTLTTDPPPKQPAPKPATETPATPETSKPKGAKKPKTQSTTKAPVETAVSSGNGPAPVLPFRLSKLPSSGL